MHNFENDKNMFGNVSNFPNENDTDIMLQKGVISINYVLILLYLCTSVFLI